MEQSLPIPVTESLKYLGPPVDANGVITKYKLELGAAERLSDIEGLTFFQPACLYTHGGFTDAHLIDMMNELKRDIPIVYVDFNFPVFSGLRVLESDEWNHELWAVATADWKDFSDFVLSLTMTDRVKKSAWRFGIQEIQIADPIIVDRYRFTGAAADFTMLPVFGFYGSHGRGYFKSVNPVVPPRFGIYPPTKEDRIFAMAYFDGLNPINTLENFKAKLRSGNAT